MGFWIFMLLMDILIPLTMIRLGRLFMTKPPENIDGAYGYRTAMSIKNKDTWEFAHKFCGKLWLRCGLVLLPISIISLIPVFNKSVDTIAYVGLIVSVVQIVLFIISIIPTEAALKKTFDENGHYR